MTFQATPPTPATKGAGTLRPLAIEVRALSMPYTAEPVLHGMDLQVATGALVAILGPTAGKTT